MSHHPSSASREKPRTTCATSHPLIRRLEMFRALSSVDRDALITSTRDVRSVPAQTDLLREGDAPEFVRVLFEGFACRYKIVDGGKRQIVGFLVPGDICDAHVFTLGHTDHNVAVLTDSKVAVVTCNVVEGVLTAHPAVARALLWSSLVNESVSRMAGEHGSPLPQQANRPSPLRDADASESGGARRR